MTVLIAVAAAVFLVLIGWVAWTALDLGSGLRRSRLAALAAQRGWSFEVELVGVAQANFHGRPFDVGRDRAATHVLRGNLDGHEILALDYEYATGKRPENTSHNTEVGITRVTVVALAVDAGGRVAPSVQVSPGKRIGRIVGAGPGVGCRLGQDELDQRFEVSATDEAFARAVLNRDVTSRLSDGNRVWRLDGPWLVALRTGPLGSRRLTVREVERTLVIAQGILQAGCSAQARDRLVDRR